jgi:putative holliday junction resolvase
VAVQSSLPTSARRLLGLDVGDRRIGVALSDPTGLLATPLEVYTRRGIDEDMRHIAGLVREHETQGVVVGLPVNMNGTEGPQAAKTREFAEGLASAGLDVLMWDERLSTVEAERRMAESGRRKKRGGPLRSDAEAAAVILETYLDYIRGRALS